MDITQWQTETDMRLNALQAQLGKTRTLARGLGVLVVALAAWVVVGAVRQPKKLVLESDGETLTLEPGRVIATSGPYTVRLDTNGLVIRDDVSKDKPTARVTPMGFRVSTDANASAELTVAGAYATMTLMAIASNEQVGMVAGGTRSELHVYGPNDHGITLEATKDGSSIAGLGKRGYGLGDTALPAASESK